MVWLGANEKNVDADGDASGSEECEATEDEGEKGFAGGGRHIGLRVGYGWILGVKEKCANLWLGVGGRSVTRLT